MINDSARRRFFPDVNPLGKRVYPSPPEFTIANFLPSPGFRVPRLTIVGVIGDVRHSGLGKPSQPELFVPHLQGTVKDNETSSPHMYLVIKTDSDPLRFVNAALPVVSLRRFCRDRVGPGRSGHLRRDVLSGAALAFGMTRLTSPLLFGVRPNDALTFLGAAAILLAVAGAASFLPSLRAARTDPLSVLRAD